MVLPIEKGEEMFVNHIHLMPDKCYSEDASIKAFWEIAEAVGIKGGVCFAPFTWQTDPLGLNQNQWLAEQIKPYPTLYGYGTLNPNKPPGDQVKEIIDLGFKGVKVHPAAQGFHMWGDWAREAYGCLEEAGLIADFHIGMHWHRIQEYHPLLTDEIAHAFPDLKMVFEHVGGWHFYREVLGVIANNRNKGNHLYAGIASVLDKEFQRYWYLGPEGLKDVRWQAGPDLMIYGLDFPYNRETQIRRDLEVIRGLGWPKEEIENLLGGNLKRLLGLTPGNAKTVGGDPGKA
jgi:predicted TIM-barrel fold metal-dependent hydrolase